MGSFKNKIADHTSGKDKFETASHDKRICDVGQLIKSVCSGL